MSFRCEFCGETSKPNTPQRLVTTQVYPAYTVSVHRGQEVVQGPQIARQKAMCQSCWEKGEVAA